MKPRRPWHQISARDEYWTLLTWLIFSGLVAFFFGLLWIVPGWGPKWWEFLTLCMHGTLNPSEGLPTGPRGRRSGIALVPLVLGVFVFMMPFVVAMIPSLAILLWIMQRAHPTDDQVKRK